jgi:hypothetical protein
MLRRTAVLVLFAGGLLAGAHGSRQLPWMAIRATGCAKVGLQGPAGFRRLAQVQEGFGAVSTTSGDETLFVPTPSMEPGLPCLTLNRQVGYECR